MQDHLVSTVSGLRDRMGRAPTSGDVATKLGVSRQYALRVLSKHPGLFSVPTRPPVWHVRGGLSGAEARMLALIDEARALVAGMGIEEAHAHLDGLRDALEVRP